MAKQSGKGNKERVLLGALFGSGVLARLRKRGQKGSAGSGDKTVADFAPRSAKTTRKVHKRSFLRRWMRRLFWLAVVLAIAPFVLMIIYGSPAVQPYSAVMLADRLKGGSVQRDWVPIEEIAPHLVYSVMMSEDAKFCSHSGVDWEAVSGVIDDAMEGETPRGASTIAMQTAKNLFLWNGRSYLRKALELPLALSADAVWSKRRMMEVYLNIAEWGPGIYGIEAASRHHFNRSAAKLTRRQAALLAVSLPNPIERNAGKPSRGLTRLARTIEARARKSGAYVKCVGLN